MGRVDVIRMSDLVQRQRLMNPVEKFYFRRLVAFMEENYPQGWQTWSVRPAPASELWGAHITQALEDEILLAIPTSELAIVFACAPAAMTPLFVRTMRRWVLSWDLGRAMIVAPLWIYERIHTADRYVGLALNPLTFGRTVASEMETASVVHETCASGAAGAGYAGPPLPWGPAVQLSAASHSPGLRPAGAALPWTSLELQSVLAGAQLPLHQCNPFPDFDS